MSTRLGFRPSLIVACLLFCGSAVIAQDGVDHGNPAVADQQGDAHSADAHEHAPDVPQAVYRHESYVGWMIRSMGLIGLLVLGSGMFCFILTLFIVIRGQGPWACAALVLFVPIPLLLGLFGTVQGLIASLQVIAATSVSVKTSEIADGVASSLFNPMLGLVMMAPSYLVATLGSIFRSFVKPAVKP
jgi:hypothetical protein